MRRWWLLSAPLGFCLLCPVAYAAEEAAHAQAHGPDWWLLGLQVLNVGILVVVLLRYVRKPLSDFLKKRSFLVREQIETAQRRLLETEQQLADLQGRLARMDAEREAFLAQAEQDARVEAQRHLAAANESSVRIQEDARRVANQEIARARRELQAEAAALATSLAADLLRERLTPDDDRRIVDECIEHIGGRS